MPAQRGTWHPEKARVKCGPYAALALTAWLIHRRTPLA